MTTVRSGAVAWLMLAVTAVAGPPPDFFQAPQPQRLAPPAPPRGRHVASYGKAYDRAYAKRFGDEVVGAERKSIAAYQAIEDERARDEGRRPRDIEKEVRGGLFAMMPPWDELFPDEGAFLGPIPFCCRTRFWTGTGWSGIEKAVAEWRSAGRPGGSVAIRLDALVRSYLREIVGDPIGPPAAGDHRRLSPVELEASVRAYAFLVAREDGSHEALFPHLRPDRFATALEARNRWFPPVHYRLDGPCRAKARWTLSSQLELVGAPEDERVAALARFDDFFAVLPDRPSVELLAARSTSDRLVERAQARENEAAVCEGRLATDVAWELETGRVFRPDLCHGLVVDLATPLDGVVADGDCWAIRPTPAEAGEELAALRHLCGEWLAADLTEEVVALRRKAWESMPERLPPVAAALLDRVPSRGELEILVSRLRGMAPKAESLGHQLGPPPDEERLARRDATRRRVEACLDHYDGRGADPRQRLPEVQVAARRNLAGLLGRMRIGEAAAAAARAEWDAEAP